MKIMKFGGSSVANAENIQKVADIILAEHQKGRPFAVVVSAMGGLTDLLIGMGKLAATGDHTYKDLLKDFADRHLAVVRKLLKGKRNTKVTEMVVQALEDLGNLLHGVFLVRELTPRTLDFILSFGERHSAFLLSEVLMEQGVPANYLDARKVVKTDDTFGAAAVDFSATNSRIQKYFEQVEGVPVITGFIGSTRQKVTTTLGRGGSDYTASIFASALHASEIEIWTDVDGVMTADPRKVKKAFPVHSMTYEEAMEMSHFGAKVIYPPTLLPALEKKIPLRIRNTFNPGFPGTRISELSDDNAHPVKGISSIDRIALITVQGSGMIGVAGTAARLFSALARNSINIILITQGSSEHSICFAVMPAFAEKAKKVIEEAFRFEIQARLIDTVDVNMEVSVVAVIGENMKSRPGISGRLFQALGKNGVNVIVTAQGSSERNITVVINRGDESKALNAVHESFFLSDTHVLNLFVVGTGLIGGTLLGQFHRQETFLRKSRALEIRVVGLSNSRKMLFREEGIPAASWPKEMDRFGDPADISAFVGQMIKMNLPNSIFVDNTAHEEVAAHYPLILENSISISTPNKVAASSAYSTYQHLKETAEKRGVKFLFETNVGAGLPVLTTLEDLIASGDRILRIEGVLSGSLSFIFNTFKEGVSFSQVVKEAQSRGFTEPDPREDLSGKDVARKLLILARESGLVLEGEGVSVENMLPEACMTAPDVDSFFTELEKADVHFGALVTKAANEGKVLRFIATLEGDKAFISLQQLGSESPFFNLSGSDNMIVFTTDRYKERPLVVKGPGAGAEVTAAGVFSEIIRIGNYLS